MSSIPTSMFPILESIVEERGVSDEIGIEFWRIEDDEELCELFFDLRSAFDTHDIDESELEQLPEGYKIVNYIFGFESACMSEGWNAFSSLSPEQIHDISWAYNYVGQKAEARAIEKAYDTWISSEEDDDAAADAYSSVENEFEDELERRKAVAIYLRDNESLFYV